MTANLRVRVTVEDAWDEIPLDLPSTTALSELKRLALSGTKVTRNPGRVSAQVPRRRALRRVALSLRRRPGHERGRDRASAPAAPAALAAPVSRSPLASRALTVIAAGFLAFDGAALLGLGVWSGRTILLFVGAILLASSGFVLLFWRRHLRRLDEIAEARADLREEAEELRRALRR